MASILLQNHLFHFEIKRKSIRSLRLRLLTPTSFSISCHHLTPISTINRFIQDHSSWIIKNSTKIKPIITISSPRLIQLKKQAKEIINHQLLQICSQYRFSYGRVSIRNQKTRFGSCSHTGNLSFNWRIAFFPQDKFRHILFHELVHLTIKNHSPRFWAALAVYDPNWRQNRKWIKENGHKVVQ